MNRSAVTLPSAAEGALSHEIDELPLAYIEIDAKGRITRANRAAIALNHPEQGQLVGLTGWDLMAVDEKDSSHADFQAYMQSNDDPPVTSRSLFDRSGKFRTYRLYRNLMRDANGKPCGMRIVCVDVTEVTRNLEETRIARRWLESAMGAVADAVILTDILGAVRYLNPAAKELTGYSAAELTGQIIEDVVPIVAYQPIDGAPLNRRAAIEKRCKGIATLLNREHQEIKVEFRSSPIVDADSDSVVGVAAVLRRTDDADRA
jgi:PAS domain S-box-containing protein